MEKDLLESVNKAAYFIWEATGYKNTLEIWYCSEDIACFLERNNILNRQDFEKIIKLNGTDNEYIGLIRNISFRIYIYTNNKDTQNNWFVAEKLSKNYEWVDAITAVADFYKNTKISADLTQNIRSDTVKKYYYPFTQKI